MYKISYTTTYILKSIFYSYNAGFLLNDSDLVVLEILLKVKKRLHLCVLEKLNKIYSTAYTGGTFLKLLVTFQPMHMSRRIVD